MRTAGLTLLLAGWATAQTAEIRLVPVATGITNATAIESPPDGSNRLFVLEQRGRIRVVKNGAVLPAPFLDFSQRVSSGGERGLLGLAFPPGYAEKRYFYIHYTDPQGNTALSRLRVTDDPDRANPDSEEVLLRQAQPFANHNGGRITFGPDGFLYFGLGDGGSSGDPQGNGQNLGTLLGKLLRIDTESGASPYASPPSNPFANRAGARPEIWAYGLRNPWKFSFDRENGNLYIADVGQNRAEEVNFQPASSSGGENYGWNRTEGLECFSPQTGCDRTGLTLPVLEYPRSQGVSVTGGFVYRGRAIPSLTGAYVYGDYGSGRIWVLRNTANGWQNTQVLASGLLISTFGQDAAGEIYMANYDNGTIYRLASTAQNLSAVNAASSGPGLVPGSLASLFGSGIAPVVGIAQAAAFPLPSTIAGASVAINGTPVPLLAVANTNGQDQINFQVPFELAGATGASLVITAGGQTSAPLEIAIAAAQPEIFTVQQQPAAWTIWATGLGAVSNAPATGQPAPSSPLAVTTGEVRVTIGGIDAQVLYAGLSPNFAGLYQVNAVPPVGIAANAEVLVRVGAAVSQPWRLPVQ